MMTLGMMIKSREFFFFQFLLPHLINGANRFEVSQEDLFECLGFIDTEFILCGLGPGWAICTNLETRIFTFSTSLGPDKALIQFLNLKSVTTHYQKFEEILRSQSNQKFLENLQ